MPPTEEVYSQVVDLTAKEIPLLHPHLGEHILESWLLRRDLTQELHRQGLFVGLPHKLTDFVPQMRKEKIPCTTYFPPP